MFINFISKNPLNLLFRKNQVNRTQNELISNLNGMAQKLERLNAGTEEDFLAIGDHLQDFSRRAREISATSAGAASLMSGAEINDAIERLGHIFNRIGDLGNECEGRTDALKKIIHILNGIEQSITGFMKIVKTLLMLGIFTRVESAHVGDVGEDFTALASQVNELAQDIELKSNKILSQSQSLAILIQQSLTNAAKIQQLQQDQLQKMVKNTTVSLTSLKEEHSRSSMIAGNIADKYKHIYSNIDQIVTLLQFHDITRQQIEHVKEAIISLSTAIQDKSGANGNRDKRINVHN